MFEVISQNNISEQRQCQFHTVAVPIKQVSARKKTLPNWA